MAGEPDGLPDGVPEGLPDGVAPGAATGASVGPKPAYMPVPGTTKAEISTSPALLSWKTTGCALPFCTASPPSTTAEALPLPPSTTEPPAGTVTLAVPSAGFRTTLPRPPGRVMASSV